MVQPLPAFLACDCSLPPQATTWNPRVSFWSLCYYTCLALQHLAPQSRLCSCLPFSSHSCIHTSIMALQMSCSMEPTSPWPKGASYSFSVSQHPTQHLILHLTEQLCSINANKAKLGLRPDLQVIKQEVGSEGIGIVWEISEKGANKNNWEVQLDHYLSGVMGLCPPTTHHNDVTISGGIRESTLPYTDWEPKATNHLNQKQFAWTIWLVSITPFFFENTFPPSVKFWTMECKKQNKTTY